MKKIKISVIISFIASMFSCYSQCGPFQIYEGFGTAALPVQGGTWSQNSITYESANARSGLKCISFNGVGDIIQTPLIINPSVFSFWYKSAVTSAHSFVVETSPDNLTWTNVYSYSGTPLTTYSQVNVTISTSNVFIRVKDTRSSGTNVLYFDDMSWTSAISSNNLTLIQGISGSASITCGLTYNLYDIGGVNDFYNDNMVSAPLTISSASAGGTVSVNFTSFSTEAGWDKLLIYNGNSTASPALHPGSGFSGTTAPGSFSATNVSGALTIDFISDYGLTYFGFVGTVSCVAPPGCATTPTVNISGLTSICAGSSATLSASSTGAVTGGVITYSAGYSIHTFTSSGVFYTQMPLTVEYLVVGGGGGGGASSGPICLSGGCGHYNGGGGGAGGMRTGTLTIPALSTYTVLVGVGGSSVTIGNGGNGSNSVFGLITSAGGGGGGMYGVVGLAGGSGGGNGRDVGGIGLGNTPATVPSQGNNGYYYGGGGGGAGASATSRDGGNGLASSISGLSTYYAGGGGGSEIAATANSIGGIGGGGFGRNSHDYPGPAGNGTPNTGGGGGGAGVGWASGMGGSGIIIVRYLTSGSGSSASTYTWSTGANTSSIVVSPSVTTTYSVAGTSSLGCVSNTVAYTVSVTPLPAVTINSGAICAGQSFTMVPSGALTYTYSSGSAIVTPTTNTSYTVTGAAAGCLNTAVSSVTVNANPIVTVNSGSICNGSSFTIVPSGASTYTYSGGSSIVSPLINTTYSVTGTSALGCVSSNTAVSSVVVNSTPLVTVSSGSICNGSSYTMIPGGASTYVYSSGGALVSPTTNTNYTVTGTSSLGCTNTAVSSVVVNAIPSVAVNSGSICNGSAFTMLPSGASTYVYSSGGALVSPTTNTSYTVIGTSAAGCSNTAISTVTVNANPTVSVNSGAICNGSSFTMIPSGASTYLFTGGSALVSPTVNTNYTVTGTSSLGCTNTAISTVTVNANPIVSVNSGSICNGSTFTMLPTGALSYVYTGGLATVSPSTTTTYSVTGTNAVGCTNTALSTVTVNAIPTIVVPSVGVCTGGTATLTPTGASTYTYSGGSAIVTPSVNTTYTVSGTSAAGCIGSAVTTVTVSGSLIFAVNSGSICSGKSFTMTPSGASTYTYSSGTSIVTPTINTTYTVTGASSVGCLGTAIASVTVNANPTVTVNSGSICNGSTFTMVPTGASTYVYTGGLATVSPSTNTTYTVTGTSALGCTNTAVSNVTVNVNPTLAVNSGSICSGNNFTFTPTGAITYSYSSGSSIVTPSVTTSYTVSGSNAFGCTTNSVRTITVSITPVIGVSSGAVCTGGSWTITPTGAVSYTYSSGSAVVTPTATTNYTVSGSNIDGCQSLAVITVTVNPTLLFNPNSGSVCVGSTFTMTPTGALSYTFSSGTAAVTPTSTTTYTIVGINSVGCLGTQICTVIVNALPTLIVNSGAICLGQSFTIVPSGASTYTYSSGSDVVNPIANTDYTVTGTDTNGCVTAIDVISSVTVNANPTVVATSDYTLICLGEVVTLNASGATSYTWNTGATTTSVTDSPTITTTYTVNASDVNGCNGISSVTVDVSDCVGLQNLVLNTLNISLYPNPTTGLVMLELNAPTQVTITNALGQVIVSETWSAGKQTFDLKNQNNGLYFVKLNQNVQQQTIKLIKQ